MLCWIHNSTNDDGNYIENQFDITRIPTEDEFEKFICQHMAQHRVLRLVAIFEGSAEIARKAMRAAIKYLPHQFSTSTKVFDVEIFWVEYAKDLPKYQAFANSE